LLEKKSTVFGTRLRSMAILHADLKRDEEAGENENLAAVLMGR